MKYYKEYQEIVKILEEIKSYVNDETDTTWAGFKDANDFLIELNKDIELLKLCDYETLEKVNLKLLATSTYQELSLSDGWSDEYLILAYKFDDLYLKISKNNFFNYLIYYVKFFLKNYKILLKIRK